MGVGYVITVASLRVIFEAFLKFIAVRAVMRGVILAV